MKYICDIKEHADKIYKMMGDKQFCVQLIITPKNGRSYASVEIVDSLEDVQLNKTLEGIIKSL